MRRKVQLNRRLMIAIAAKFPNAPKKFLKYLRRKIKRKINKKLNKTS